jgi:hypothetical protein
MAERLVPKLSSRLAEMAKDIEGYKSLAILKRKR